MIRFQFNIGGAWNVCQCLIFYYWLFLFIICFSFWFLFSLAFEITKLHGLRQKTTSRAHFFILRSNISICILNGLEMFLKYTKIYVTKVYKMFNNFIAVELFKLTSFFRFRTYGGYSLYSLAAKQGNQTLTTFGGVM